MKCLATNKPSTIPTPTAASALIRRLRNSTRWSKKDIAAPASSSACCRGVSSGGADAAIFYSFGIFLGLGGLRFVGPAAGIKLGAGEVGIVPGIFPAQIWVGDVLGWKHISARARDGGGIGWFGGHGSRR